MLKGKKILLAVSGSIAAYKAAVLVRLLIRAGAEVKVVMTDAATGFISPLTLSTLSRNEVLSALSVNDSWANHVMLGRWADIMLIAPLSCNTLAKMANGICDNLLLAVYLSAVCPVAVAPAMDEDMWKHATTINNINKLRSFGNHIIPVDNGELASGLFGEGRMAEPEHIVDWLTGFFLQNNELSGKRVLVTAGPTYESIDPVRFIGNHSSGKMGIAIAEECQKRGATVYLVTGPTTEPIDAALDITRVVSAADMYAVCVNLFPTVDIAIMSAAVADYTILNPATEKIKKNSDTLTIELKKTEDILGTLGQQKTDRQFLAGFALETNNEKEYAIKKLQSKHADMIVMNSLKDEGAGFEHNTNKITIFDKSGKEYFFDMKSKREIAADIVNTILKIIHE